MGPSAARFRGLTVSAIGWRPGEMAWHRQSPSERHNFNLDSTHLVVGRYISKGKHNILFLKLLVAQPAGAGNVMTKNH